VSSLAVTLAFGSVAALGVVLGGLILVAKRWERAFLRYFVAIGAGFMLAAAILEMIPESIERAAHAPLFVLIGYMLIHLFEHTLARHFHFGEEIHGEAVVGGSTGIFGLLGLGVHSLFDGVAIASGFAVSVSLGILLFFAVLLHKIPEGFTSASLMLAAGYRPRQALGSAILVGGATIAGVLLTNAVLPLAVYGLALSAGVTIYVAASDLMPEVHKQEEGKIAFLVFCGVALFYALDLLLGAVLGRH
jgi:ZIP family zinc transporter/zinc and cadmium transporter